MSLWLHEVFNAPVDSFKLNVGDGAGEGSLSVHPGGVGKAAQRGGVWTKPGSIRGL